MLQLNEELEDAFENLVVAPIPCGTYMSINLEICFDNDVALKAKVHVWLREAEVAKYSIDSN